MLDDGCSFVSMKTGKRSTSDDKLWLVVGHVPNARFMEPDNNAKTVIMDRIGEIQREGCIGTECGMAERVSVYLYPFATRYVLTCVDATSWLSGIFQIKNNLLSRPREVFWVEYLQVDLVMIHDHVMTKLHLSSLPYTYSCDHITQTETRNVTVRSQHYMRRGQCVTYRDSIIKSSKAFSPESGGYNSIESRTPKSHQRGNEATTRTEFVNTSMRSQKPSDDRR